MMQNQKAVKCKTHELSDSFKKYSQLNLTLTG